MNTSHVHSPSAIETSLSLPVFATGTAVIAAVAAVVNETIRYFAVSTLDASGFGPLGPGLAAAVTVFFALVAGFAGYQTFRHVRYPALFYPILSAWVLASSFLPIVGMAIGAEEAAGVSAGALRTLALMHLTAYFLVVPAVIALAKRARR
jgi:hypothetical protein